MLIMEWNLPSRQKKIFCVTVLATSIVLCCYMLWDIKSFHQQLYYPRNYSGVVVNSDAHARASCTGNCSTASNVIASRGINVHTRTAHNKSAVNVESYDKKRNMAATAITLKQPTCEHGRYLVYTCDNGHGCGGWGDRLKGIISTFLLAQHTNRTFVIMHNDPCPLSELLQHRMYDWTKCLPQVNQIPKNQTIHYRVLNSASGVHKLLNIDLTYASIHILTNIYIIESLREQQSIATTIPWIINKTFDEIITTVLTILFKPTTKLQDELNLFLKTIKKGTSLVCCHLRYGRNPSIPNDSSLRQGAPNVSTVFEFLDGYRDNGKYAIFLASDSQVIKEQAWRRYPNLASLNRTIVHVDKWGSAEKRAACDGFLTALLEQQILTRCDVILLTRSNFGAMAAYMRRRTDGLFLYRTNRNDIVNGSPSDVQSVYGFV